VQRDFRTRFHQYQSQKIDQKLLIWNLGDNLLPILDDRWWHIPQQCKTTYFPEKKCEYNDAFWKLTGWMEIEILSL